MVMEGPTQGPDRSKIEEEINRIQGEIDKRNTDLNMQDNLSEEAYQKIKEEIGQYESALYLEKKKLETPE
jgi:hypothetical protein